MLLSELFGVYEHTAEAVGHARELVLGSFDLYMTSTGQRTNDIMRVLTVATVALGIVAAVAGLMGMNFQADIFKTGNTGFRDVLIFSAALTGSIVAVGRGASGCERPLFQEDVLSSTLFKYKLSGTASIKGWSAG